MCSILAFHGLSISPASTSDSSVQKAHRKVAQLTIPEEGKVYEGGKNEWKIEGEEKGEDFPRYENAIFREIEGGKNE